MGCTDIDECLTDKGGCHADAHCQNVPGARKCICNDGYEGVGEGEGEPIVKLSI